MMTILSELTIDEDFVGANNDDDLVRANNDDDNPDDLISQEPLVPFLLLPQVGSQWCGQSHSVGSQLQL